MNAAAMLPPDDPVSPPDPKRTTAADRSIGRRISALRKAQGLTQTALGQALGLTFQQIQKYEKGANRVGAARLQDIARVFGVSVALLYEPAEDAPDGSGAIACLAVDGAPELLRLFARIESTSLRRHVLEHVRATAQLGQRQGSAQALPQAEDA